MLKYVRMSLPLRHILTGAAALLLLGACGPEATPLIPQTGSAANTPDVSRLSSFRVTGVALDDKDLAWVATDGTLASYDGANLRLFPAQDGKDRLQSDDISCVFSDHASAVWIGTDRGLYTYERYSRFQLYTDQYGRSVPVTQIAETSDDVLLIASGEEFYRLNEEGVLIPLPSLNQPGAGAVRMMPCDDGGVWIATPTATVHYNRSFEEIERFAAVRTTTENLSITRGRDKIWVLQGRDLSCFDLRSSVRDYVLRLEEYPINFIYYDEPYLLLKSRRYGLQAFDPVSRLFVDADLSYIPTNPSRTDISLFSEDRLGNLWIGYEHYGLNCVSREQRRLQLMNSGALHRTTRGEYIGSLFRSGDGAIWGNLGQQIFRQDPARDAVDFYDLRSVFGEDSQVSTVVTDEADGLWLIGYSKIGVGAASPHPRMAHTRQLGFRPGHAVALEGKCYLTANTPYLYSYDGSGHLDSLRIDGETAPYYDRNARILPVGRNNLLILCSGLVCTLVHPDQGTSEPMTMNNERISRDERVIDAALDGQTVWLSLGRGGLYALDLGSGSVSEIPELSGLGISGILRYSDNRLVFGSGSGVFFFDLRERKLRNVNLQLGNVLITAFTPGGAVRGVNSIVMGTNDGCITIPADIPMQAENHFVSVQRMLAHGRDGSSIVNLPAGEGSVVLDHRHNSFEIRYGCVSYDNQPVEIEYMLEGYNTEWAEAPRERTAYYEKLPAGKYTFRLREMQPYSNSVLDERSMLVTVHPSPWKTFPALLLYFLLVAALIWLIIWSLIKMRTDKMKLGMAEQRHELERRTNQMNMNFFANVAHEFRNPLTIISGPLESLSRDDSLSTSARKKVTAISESANSMLRLIDQMLDFNQLEMDVLKLCVGERDVPYELSRMAEIYRESANPRGIRIETSGLEELYVTTVDMDKIDKIMGNLFTNALKHTPDGGVIGLSFDTISREEAAEEFPGEPMPADHYFVVRVTNNGRTIPEDKLPNVFLRYYQSSETADNHDYGWGRGIGLYYVKQLVRIHGGAIRVHNLSNGVCFSFIIPTDNAYYEGVDRENEKVHRILQIDVAKEKPGPEAAPEAPELRPTLLLVDDDLQVSSYLRSIFEDSFNIVNKYSAEAALSELEKINPDLIISDVVMGRMNGYEFCRSVKSNLMFSHIPFILLTAKTDVEDSVSGLESGANAYVAKPFSPEYLTALVHSLLRNVEHVRSFLNAHTDGTLIEDGTLSEQDSAFMRDLYDLMEQHLSDADLNVSSICEELRISRSKFNYKLKGLTGSSPGTFFRHYKLNRAAKLLKEGKHNVSEVADMIGFSSISNFSASFKKLFGVAPRDYQ